MTNKNTMPKKKQKTKSRTVKKTTKSIQRKSSSKKKPEPKKKPVKQIRVRRKKHAIQSKIYRRKLKLKEFKKKGEMAPFRKISRQIMELRGGIKELNKKLGIKSKPKPDLAKIKADLKKAHDKISTEDRKEDYIEDSTPYAVWQAHTHVNKQIWNTRWKWIIVDGKRFSTKEEIRLEANIADAFSAFDSNDVITISYNPKTKTLRYELY